MDPALESTIKLIIEVLLAIGGLSGLATVIVTRRKTKAEAKKIDHESKVNIPVKAAGDLIQTGGELIDEYKNLLEVYKKESDTKFSALDTEIRGLKIQLNRYAKRIEYLMSGISTLVAQVKSVGKDPCWTPDQWPPDDSKGQ